MGRNWSAAAWFLAMAGKGLAVALFLFWGFFFVDHLGEWFLRAGEGWPPPRVWLAQGLHLAMLAGLLLMAFRTGPGAAATVATTAAFFLAIGYRGTPALPLANMIPIVLLALGAALARAGGDQA